MSSVNVASSSSVGACAARAVWETGLSSASDGAFGEPSILPATEPLACSGVSDAMSLLYQVFSTRRQLDLQSGQSQISIEHERSDKAVADRLSALKRQVAEEASSGNGFFSCVAHFFEDIAGDAVRGRFDVLVEDAAKDVETAWNSPAFWRDLEQGAMMVAKVALAVGGVAASVVTAGAAAPVLIAAAIALSGGGLVVSQTGCADGVFGQGSSQWVGLVLEVGGAVAGCGAGFAGAGGQAIAAAGQSAAAKTAGAIGGTADIIGGSLQVVAGAAQIRSGSFAADGQRASTDATLAMQQVARLDRVVASLIETIQQSDKSYKRAQASLASAMATHDQTSVSATTLSLRG